MMENDNNFNINNQIPEAENYSTILYEYAEAITTIGNELTKIAAEFPLKKVQSDSNIYAVKNLQRQIDFLTNEIKNLQND